jgi:hypothetical protein
MKLTRFLSVFFFLYATVAFAQEVVSDPLSTQFSALSDFFLPSLIASALVLLADAKKWMFTGEWSFRVFFNTKAVPFLLGNLGAIALYYLFAYLPWSQQFVEVLGGYELTELTAATLSGMATAIINGFMKKKETPDAS